MELETMTTFARSNVCKRGSKTIAYYYCGRAGHLKSASTGIRKLKQCGSRKMGAVCPAQISLYDSGDGQIEVQFVGTHVGHEFETVHCQGHLKKYANDEPATTRRSRRQRIPHHRLHVQQDESAVREPEIRQAIVSVDLPADTNLPIEQTGEAVAVYQLVHDHITNEPVYILQIEGQESEARVEAGVEGSQERETRRSTRRPQVTSLLPCNMCSDSVSDLRQHYQMFHHISPSKIDLFIGIK